MFAKSTIIAIGLLFGLTVAAPGTASRKARGNRFECCRCADSDVSANVCAAVNFDLCGNSNGAYGIYVGHANDIDDFTNACENLGSEFGSWI